MSSAPTGGRSAWGSALQLGEACGRALLTPTLLCSTTGELVNLGDTALRVGLRWTAKCTVILRGYGIE